MNIELPIGMGYNLTVLHKDITQSHYGCITIFHKTLVPSGKVIRSNLFLEKKYTRSYKVKNHTMSLGLSHVENDLDLTLTYYYFYLVKSILKTNYKRGG